MKNIKQLLILCLFLLAGQGSVQAQGANDFSVSDSDARFPTSLNSIKTRMNNDGHFIFAIARNTDRSGGMSNKAYFVYSVLRSDVLGSFSGTGYVTFFDANLNFVERVELSRNETTGNKYADGNSAVTFINQNGEAIGVSTGGNFLYDYEGPWVEPRNQRFAGYTDITRETSKMPQKIRQTIRYIYRDRTTGVEHNLYETKYQEGIEGQAFTTKQIPIEGYFIRTLPTNITGYLSPFKKGYTYTKHPHPGLSLVYTQLDDNGRMDIKVYWNGYDEGRTPYKHYTRIEPGDSGTTFSYGGYLYNISNPYIPRTDEVVYVYEKVGKVIYTSNDSAFLPHKGSKPYTSDPNDVRKVLDEIVPTFSGWEAYYNGQRIQEGSRIVIADPGVDTTIEYRRIPVKHSSRVNPQLRIRTK